MKLAIGQVARMTGGRVFPPAAQGTVTGVSTDSRTLQPGDLFVPLRGENFDGHDFLMQAARRGAAACLSEDVIAGFPIPVVGVEDTLTALGDLAAGFRRAFAGPIIAVTGSSGKTTTKDMLAGILSATGPGLATAGNFNNLIGLPLTLLRLMPRHRWAVVEMGMSARGEIARLARIAAPGIGVVTNVGPAHLEQLQTLDGVARAKGELFAALPAGGTAVINADDERVVQLPVANGARRLCYSLDRKGGIHAANVADAPAGCHFELVLPDGRFPVQLAASGRHNVSNALAAATAAVALDIPGSTIAAGLETFRPAAGRLERLLLDDGVTLFDDSYNANPLSVAAALEALAATGGSEKIAVLGDMLELGGQAAELHRRAGAAAARRIDRLVVVGEFAAETARGAREAGLAPDRVRLAADHDEALEILRSWLGGGETVLIKGSRGMHMDQIVAGLRRRETCRRAGNC